MKPFDLEAAKRGEPVQTRDGKPARIICFDRVSSSGRYPLVAAFFGSEPTHEDVSLYTPEGRYSEGCTREHPLDLVMAPVQREGWVHKYSDNVIESHIYQTKEEAEQSVRFGKPTIAKIIWEE